MEKINRISCYLDKKKWSRIRDSIIIFSLKSISQVESITLDKRQQSKYLKMFKRSREDDGQISREEYNKNENSLSNSSMNVRSSFKLIWHLKLWSKSFLGNIGIISKS